MKSEKTLRLLALLLVGMLAVWPVAAQEASATEDINAMQAAARAVRTSLIWTPFDKF